METTGKSLRAVPPCTNEERQKRKIMCNKASQSSVAVMQGDWGEKPHHCLGRIPFQLARLVHGALHKGFLILPDAFAFFKIPYQVYARAQLVFGNFYHQQVSQFICFRGKQMRFTEPHYLPLVTGTQLSLVNNNVFSSYLAQQLWRELETVQSGVPAEPWGIVLLHL